VEPHATALFISRPCGAFGVHRRPALCTVAAPPAAAEPQAAPEAASMPCYSTVAALSPAVVLPVAFRCLPQYCSAPCSPLAACYRRVHRDVGTVRDYALAMEPVPSATLSIVTSLHRRPWLAPWPQPSPHFWRMPVCGEAFRLHERPASGPVCLMATPLIRLGAAAVSLRASAASSSAARAAVALPVAVSRSGSAGEPRLGDSPSADAASEAASECSSRRPSSPGLGAASSGA